MEALSAYDWQDPGALWINSPQGWVRKQDFTGPDREILDINTVSVLTAYHEIESVDLEIMDPEEEMLGTDKHSAHLNQKKYVDRSPDYIFNNNESCPRSVTMVTVAESTSKGWFGHTDTCMQVDMPEFCDKTGDVKIPVCETSEVQGIMCTSTEKEEDELGKQHDHDEESSITHLEQQENSADFVKRAEESQPPKECITASDQEFNSTRKEEAFGEASMNHCKESEQENEVPRNKTSHTTAYQSSQACHLNKPSHNLTKTYDCENPYALRDLRLLPGLGNDYVKQGTTWVKKSETFKQDYDHLSHEERLLKIASYEEMMRHKELSKCSQPHVIITKGITKEQKVVISTAEALTRLDMAGSAKDTRRFGYVCKLLEYFITNKLSSLSGTAQKMLFNGLEDVLNQVIATNNNIHIMKYLLKEAKYALKQSQYDHVGSYSLWTRHVETVDRLQNTLNNYEIEQREEDGKVKISDLPDECIHQILYRLTDHRDLVNAGLTESRTFDLSEANTLWRQLCLFHFTNKQWIAVLKKGETMETFGWKALYSRLVRRYGQREVYSEMLHLCRHCNALFWNLHGHPCLLPDMKPESIPITPEMCVALFNA